MRVAVVGGTGVVGRYVVSAAKTRGHEVLALARSTGVDVSTGAGLADALVGVDVVIDVTNTATLSARAARQFFESATRNLLAAEESTGVRHHVVLSIVGIDGIDAGYYAGKLAQERVAAAGDVPHTIVRTAQFHEFVGQQLDGQRGPLAFMPTMLTRPVAAREVGEYLVTVAEGEPAGRAADLVGPQDERLADLARRQLAHDGIIRKVVELRLPGAFGKGLASGTLRGTPSASQGVTTFDTWLATPDHAPAS